MIPGMFCTAKMPERVAEYLTGDFYLILPTLDGHYREEPVYHSKQKDAEELISWLHENHVERLALLQGTSMGAEVALEVARQIDLPVNHFLFDGGPFFHFPPFVRALTAFKFQRFAGLLRGKSREEARNLILNSRFVVKLGGKALDSYPFVLDDMIEIARWIDKDSIRRIADTCYLCDLPSFPEDTIRRFTFLYAKTETARRAEKRLRPAYPSAEYLTIPDTGHGGFQLTKPEEYADLLRKEAGR